MNIREKRLNERYNHFEIGLIAEYCIISPKKEVFLELESMGDTSHEYRSALIHNISHSGICLSADDPNLDVGRELELFLTVTDPEAGEGSLSLALIAKVVWVSEDPSGYRAGMQFVEVPEDYIENFERIVSFSQVNHPVR